MSPSKIDESARDGPAPNRTSGVLLAQRSTEEPWRTTDAALEAPQGAEEAQFLQAQKMEALGRLAGGVAHDFNNILTVILSYAEMMGAALPPDGPLRADIEEIRTAALRATDLTKQLLAFSRQQVLEPKVLDLGQAIVATEKMLGRLLGADVDLTVVVASGLWNVKADPGQIEQILMNLAVNARDAMPRGGKLTIETANVTLDEDYALAHRGVQAGSYVMLAVSDTGIGMERETLARVFEPFFTTKEPGKGSSGTGRLSRSTFPASVARPTFELRSGRRPRPFAAPRRFSSSRTTPRSGRWLEAFCAAMDTSSSRHRTAGRLFSSARSTRRRSTSC